MTEYEREQLEVGLRSKDAFVLRRCQILLASARGERAPAIARSIGCDDETVRDRLSFIAFHEGYHMGALGALRKPSGTRVRRKR